MSQPFCVDQLNPAGFNVFNVPYKETDLTFTDVNSFYHFL